MKALPYVDNKLRKSGPNVSQFECPHHVKEPNAPTGVLSATLAPWFQYLVSEAHVPDAQYWRFLF